MKKFIFPAVVTACSLLTVSCEVDSVKDTSAFSKNNPMSTEKSNLHQSDSIPIIKSTTMANDDGPDDEVFPTSPPKKK